MDKKRKHIDDLFREKVGDHSEVPPSDAWLDMDKKLDTLLPHTPPGNPFRWLGHVGFVSLIAVLGVSVINKFSSKKNSSQLVYNTQSINKIEPVTETKKEDITATQPQEVALSTTDAQQEEEATTSVKHITKHDDALAFGESYSENADNEYIEGVTEIKKEDYGLSQAYVNEHRDCIVQLEIPENQNSNYLSKLERSADGQYIINKQDPKPEIPRAAYRPAEKIGEDSNTAAKIADNTRVKPNLRKWELGMKGGYERGFNNTAATGLTVSPYVTYKLSDKVGIMTQPTAKFATAPERNVDDPTTYYKINSSEITAAESFVTSTIEGVTTIYYNNTSFHYSQSYDSIVKTNKTGGKYVQFELPVLLNYKIGKKIAVYGGVNTVYSQLQSVTEYTYTKAGIIRTADVLVKSKETPAAPATNDVITHTGKPYSEYNGPDHPSDHESNLRVGAMVGVNYEYNNRWLVDAMVQKTPAPTNVKSGYNVNAPLSAPSFRLSVGYKIKK